MNFGRYWTGLWTVVTNEQVMMKFIKSLTRGCGLT